MNASFGLETVGQASQTFGNTLPTAFAGTSGDPATKPYAYLNYIVFDTNYTLKDAGAIRVPDNAGFDAGMESYSEHRQLAFAQPIQPQQAGYVYVWVSNETQGSKVWFDDVKVTHTYSRVTQASDYYAFGSVMREQKSPDDLVYRYGYQGNYSEKDLETNWNHFELREFDAVVGRWTAIDPKRQFFSPYIGMGNNPVKGVDMDGGSVDDFYIYSDGSIEYVPTGNTDNFYYVTDDFNVITLAEGWQRNANGLLQMPASFTFNQDGISFGFSVKPGQQDRAFVKPESMAAMFGAFVETGYTDFTITQFSYANGSSPAPSVSHINGTNGDFRYLRTDGTGGPVTVFEGAFDMIRNSRFTNALHKYGYKDMKSYTIPFPLLNAGILPHTSHLKNHHHHLHLQGFKPNIRCADLPSVFAGPR